MRGDSTSFPEGSTPAGALVNALAAAGTTHAFMVPGESFLPVIDALYSHPAIRLVTTRHEGGASFMAAAFARLTGQPTICLASRIPGASNLAIGLHTAMADRSPVVALLGQVSTSNRYRKAFQEVDLAQFLGPITKWVVEPADGNRLGELGHAAARIALSGRPGPAAIVMAQDVLGGSIAPTGPAPITLPRPSADPEEVNQTLRLLREASSPVVWVGGGVIDADAVDLVVAFVEHEEIPVISAWRRPDAFPNQHRLYLGQSGLGAPTSVLARLRAADLILAVGSELGQLSTFNYSALEGDSKVVHVLGHSEGLGGPFPGAVVILADPFSFFTQLLTQAQIEPLDTNAIIDRRQRNNLDRGRWVDESTPHQNGQQTGYVDQAVLAHHLRSIVPSEAIVTNDAGSFSAWITRFLPRQLPRTYLAPTSGAMGYAVPAALAAALARPDVPAIAIVGDGGFMMTGAEVETAVREGLPITVIVVDNSEYGTIRLHQERARPDHYPGSRLGPIDFAAYARSLGASGIVISSDDETADGLMDAFNTDAPIVVHVKVNPAQLEVDDLQSAHAFNATDYRAMHLDD